MTQNHTIFIHSCSWTYTEIAADVVICPTLRLPLWTNRAGEGVSDWILIICSLCLLVASRLFYSCSSVVPGLQPWTEPVSLNITGVCMHLQCASALMLQRTHVGRCLSSNSMMRQLLALFSIVFIGTNAQTEDTSIDTATPVRY
jgi:hypothetical protein